LPGCAPSDPAWRYTEGDIQGLHEQRIRERARTGTGRLGVQRYKGYRGLAELPWFDVDERGRLVCTDPEIPQAIDVHCHLGITSLFAGAVDLQARSERVLYALDCDAHDGGCDLDLDIYINGNFEPADLSRLHRSAVAQALFVTEAARTHTIPNLLAEMDDCRVEQAWTLPLDFGLPFGVDLSTEWIDAIEKAGVGERLVKGASVHPRDSERIAKLEALAASGARVVKLHPTMQRFYPDDRDVMELYAACERLGLVVFFHCGRAGIEPEATHRYALPRHYAGAIESFPNVPFVLGHAGARDAEKALELRLRYENAWLGVHGQGVSQLDRMVRKTGGERLLFGTDWPFYHLASSLAKILLVSEGEPCLRYALLRGNAERVLAPKV
jgi:hypothetical protein